MYKNYAKKKKSGYLDKSTGKIRSTIRQEFTGCWKNKAMTVILNESC